MRIENGWVIDANNNRACIERWGTEEAATKALESCSRCYDCYDCSDCSDCSDCYDCYDCSRCSGCSRCSDCSGCSRCYDCSGMAPQKIEQQIPKLENIHQSVYAAASQPKALNMDSFHTCETTHCRAGWVVHLAGAPGYDLERRTSSVFAAMQIYKASGYEISPCRFFDSNEDAMADMKRLAEAAEVFG